jgi:tryptophan synthase alpha chain
VGFGIRSPQQAEAIARIADGVVVGSAIVSQVADHLGSGRDKIVAEVLALTRALAGSTHAARHGKVPA